LALGRGGAILLNDKNEYEYLKRLCYDGRNAYISDNKEINENPNDIICGYHSYMEPDKAAIGILKMNQVELLPKYIEHDYSEYVDLTKLNIW
jgi:dTDP-4-amino-4,6-dideoxygalactose transaminase